MLADSTLQCNIKVKLETIYASFLTTDSIQRFSVLFVVNVGEKSVLGLAC